MNQRSNRHECYLQKKSISCLAQLPPNSAWYRRAWRAFRKYFLVSERHKGTKFHFRSSASILLERRRHVQYYPSYIIHPFSLFAYYREVILFFVFCSTFIIAPVATTFLLQDEFNTNTIKIVRTTNFFINLIIMFNVGLCFVCGYLEHQTKNIVLEPRKVALTYIKGFFWSDFIGAMPITFLMHYVPSRAYHIFLMAKHTFLYPRVASMLTYSRHITIFFRMSDAQHEIFRMILLSLFMLHWSACLLYAVQYIYHFAKHTNDSWMYEAGIHPYISKDYEVSLKKKYILCLHMAMCHFYRIGAGIYNTYSTGDHVVLSLIMTVGAIYYAYIIVIVLQAIGTANASESKYEELMRQIYHFLRSKRMPFYIDLRLRTYYEYRFQRRYFREQAIMSTLSEHLKYEIKLCTTRHLIGKVSLFKGLSKSLVGSIIGGLILDIYLTNDVIMQADVPSENWYIISYGTVSVIHKSGAEIYHLQDGESFGEMNILTGESDVSVVAIEISEVFSMPKRDFERYLSNETIKKRIKDIMNDRADLIKILVDRYKHRSQERQEVLYKVRSGKILEKGYLRR